MDENIWVGANGVTALKDATFEEMGLTEADTRSVSLISPWKSWKPGRTLNGITGIEKGKSYYFISKIDRDLTEYFSPPLNMTYYSFESQGVLPTNTPEQNKIALQAAIDKLTDPSQKTKVLYGEGNYPIMGPIDIKPDVVIMGNSSGIKGSPNTAMFTITDTQNNVFRMCVRSTLQGWTFDYPNNNQNTIPESVITYPTTVVNYPGYICSIRIKDINFVGGTKFLQFVQDTACEDLHFENWYGYPLGGTMWELAYCYDIPYIDLIHVNPGAGRQYRTLNSQSGLPFTMAMLDYVIANAAPTFIIDRTDEFVLSRLFGFGVKTGLKISNSYGSVVQANFDIVETAFDIAINENRKAVVLDSCSCIPSGGPTPSNRNAVKFGGAGGTLNIQGLNVQLGTNAVVPGSNNPNGNAAVLVNGTGSQRLIMHGVTSYSGNTFTYDVRKTNASAEVIATACRINNATTKIINSNFFAG